MMIETDKQSVFQNLGSFLKKEVDVTAVFKEFALDPDSRPQSAHEESVSPQMPAFPARPSPPRGRLLFFPSKPRVETT
jgi:hypothetical protein